ncbi:hypothetical protein CUR178_01910 [Leishmania enriettii]|uniref:Fungal lipase-type domain-containing protein n=1 Tax=Leishmania enriettii TaxID=5663 RepID=A0A836G7V5_LEIEN|nr:hypothetical protein CUR178_01908 [Leishmania enriettii]KAG5469771.1 hypothetical protein CUR178_01910 [Leishmania enriettii]
MGFLSSYMSVRSQVRSSVEDLLPLLPRYQVLVMGHSFGGAFAVHAAADLQVHSSTDPVLSQPVALYTLGAPRVGDRNLAQWTAQVLASGPHYRITHGRDPVPRMPSVALGFLHAPADVFYRTIDNSSMTVCDDSSTSESNECSNSMLDASTADHFKYLGEDTGCSCDGCQSYRLEFVENQATTPKWLYARLAWDHLKSSTGMLNTTAVV